MGMMKALLLTVEEEYGLHPEWDTKTLIDHIVQQYNYPRNWVIDAYNEVTFDCYEE